MLFLQTNYFNLSSTLAVGILFTTLPLCLAGDKEEKAAASAMIAFVESGKSGQAEAAKKLFDSIPAESKSKAVATYSLALVHMRERQYSEASRVLDTPSRDSESESDSIKFGKERLKLWLYLEEGLAAKAETQFKRLVGLTLRAESPSAHQNDSCGYIGGVVGMLKTDVESSSVPLPLLDKAREQLQSKVESKNAIAELEKQLTDASEWGAELSSLVSKFDSIGTEKAAEQNKVTQAELERTKQEQLKLRDDLKEAGGDKRDLEVQFRKGIKNQGVANANLQSERQKRPAEPIHPGPQPRQPHRPKGSYKIDPKTQERKYEEPPARDMKLYEQELAMFKSWPARAAKFQSEKDEYPAKLQRWQQQVAALEDKAKEAINEVASLKRAMADMQAEIKQGVGNELKETTDQLGQLERTAAISNIAFSHLTSKDPKSKSAIRPSNFQLIDFASECTQLRKSLR
jgi:DNA repair exonuclease SbcCD ATPase subunit